MTREECAADAAALYRLARHWRANAGELARDDAARDRMLARAEDCLRRANLRRQWYADAAA
jgi:hypothetical protein